MASDFHFQSMRIPVVLACLVLAGCGGTPPAKTREAPRVTVAHPEVRNLLDEDEYNGWLAAYKSVDVRSRVRGHITKVHFQDGDFVAENKTPLFDIDEDPFLAELAQTEAQIKSLEAQEVAAQKVAERDRILIKSNAVSQQELDKAEADAKSFAAQVLVQKAQADRIGLDLKYAKIIAPLTGKISKANLVAGDLVNAGGTDPVLATIVTIDPIYVDFNVDERAIQQYQQANSGGKDKQLLRDMKIPFTFALDTETGFPHEGKLVFTDIKFAEGTGTVLVRGEASNTDGRLIPGSRVRVRVPVGAKYEAVVVPDSAILSDQEKRYLLVLGKDNKVLRRNVKLGRLLDDGMRVVKPDSAEQKAGEAVANWGKDWVITLGLQRARIDYEVQPMDDKGQPIDTKAAAQ